MKYFVSCLRNGEICYMSWEGQTQDIIISLLADLNATNIQFITEAEYNTYIQILQGV